MAITKINFICKEKSGTITKIELITQIKKYNQLYFGTLFVASYYNCVDNA